MLHLAAKAFWPAPVPFPVLHVDTGHNFPEVLAFRDATVDAARPAARGRAACRTTSTTAGCASAPTAPATRCRPCRCSTPSRRTGSTPSSAAAAATRRRPAPRSASSACATSSASGTRATSAPSCGTSTTAGTAPASTSGSSRCRNWTELDVWRYIEREGIELPSLVLRARARGLRARRHAARGRPRTRRPRTERGRHAAPVRYRTVGDMSCTGAVEQRRAHRRATSSPRSPRPALTERGATRADDRMSEAAMEDRKKEGYF